MSPSLTWGEPERRPRRPRALFSRVAGALAWALAGTIAIAVYTNVIVDDSDLRIRTEALARETARCGDGCRITSTQIRRTVLEYRADFELDSSGSVRVVCRRDAIAFGPQRCTTRTSE
ncbi:MAG: hypothetical protein KF894_02495 [Labilithrix sp.]|nr:hypothetical protein [Labilithrix sp.]